jgi:hypothetical protein
MAQKEKKWLEGDRESERTEKRSEKGKIKPAYIGIWGLSTKNSQGDALSSCNFS